MPAWSKGLGAGVLGLALGVMTLVGLYQLRDAFVLEMDRETPAFTTGFYPSERDGELTFSWTAERSVVRLAGLDRRLEWRCLARLRSSRPSDQPRPVVTLAADAVTASMTPEGAEFTELALSVPPRPDRPGLIVSLTTEPVFRPGGQDTRRLGVQVDRFTCEPSAGFLWPPAPGLWAMAAVMAAWGLAFFVAGFSLRLTTVGLAILAAGTAFLSATGGGAFGSYPDLFGVIGVASAAVAGLVGLRVSSEDRTVGAADRLLVGRMAATPAAVAWVSSAGLLCLELLALSHPGKMLVDAVFQAHRLEWVVAGRYFFTQPLPDGVAFPYAIGLFVTAAPFAGWVTDHVLLVRLVTLVGLAAAGLAVFAVVSREWRMPWCGVAALFLVHITPLTFVVLGNANLPNVFAQSVAAVGVLSVVWLWRSTGRAARVMSTLVVAAVVAYACLSHVSTVALVSGTLACVAVVAGVWGGREGRRIGMQVLAALGLALVVAVLLYYRHFPEVYERFLSRVTTTSVDRADVQAVPSDRPALLTRPLTWSEKARDTGTQTAQDLGWPLAGLAALGLWRLWREGARDPLSIVLIGWLVAWTTLVVASTVLRVDTAYQRYALEFVSRTNLAGYPAAALLAARGLRWAWQPAGPLLWPRVVCLALLGAAAWEAVGRWAGWIG